MKHKQPAVTVDIVAFDTKGRLLLIRRKYPPFQHVFALPGGFVEVGETVEAAALREFKEETGLEAPSLKLIGVYSEPKRDPRGHTISIAYLSAPLDQMPAAGDDAAHAEFVENWKRETLAFDHSRIAEDAFRLVRKRNAEK